MCLPTWRGQAVLLPEEFLRKIPPRRSLRDARRRHLSQYEYQFILIDGIFDVLAKFRRHPIYYRLIIKVID